MHPSGLAVLQKRIGFDPVTQLKAKFYRAVDKDLSLLGQGDFQAFQRSGGGAFEIHSAHPEPAPVTRTFEFILTRPPVRCATEMSAARIDYKDAVRRLVDPDAILLLPFCIDAQRVVRGKANFKLARRFQN